LSQISSDRLVERNGAIYTMNATNIGHSQPQENYADIFDPVGQVLSTNWGLVNGEPFDMPLPDGKPVEIPEDWKLSSALRNVDGIPLADGTAQHPAWSPMVDARPVLCDVSYVRACVNE
jgi:hypothetical protein